MAMVLLHPLPMDGSVWTAVADGMDADVVVVRSLYCLGESMGDWASAVIDLVGRGPHTVVGNSIGASCAVEVAHIAPGLVERLVIVGGKLGHRREPNLRDEAIRVLTDEGLDSAWTRYWAPLFGPSADPGLIEATRRRVLCLNVDDIIRGVRVFHNREDRSRLCERWGGRLEIVSGAHDRSPTTATAARALDQARQGQLHVVAGAGHYVPLEAPRELVDILLRGTGDT